MRFRTPNFLLCVGHALVLELRVPSLTPMADYVQVMRRTKSSEKSIELYGALLGYFGLDLNATFADRDEGGKPSFILK